MEFLELVLFFLFSFTGILLILMFLYQVFTRKPKRNGLKKGKENISESVIQRLINISDALPYDMVEAFTKGDPKLINDVVANFSMFNPGVQERLRNLFVALGIIDKYIGELNCEKDDLRVNAAENLGKIGAPQAIKPLLEAMSDKKEEVSMAAARALSWIKYEQVPQNLIKAMGNPGKWLPARVAEVLIAHGSGAVPSLLNSLISNADVATKAKYIEIIGEIKDKEAVPTLVAALESSFPEIRVEAARALGNIRDPRAVEGLIKTLHDQSTNVRALTARALGMIKDPRAIIGLQTILHDQDWNVRINAIQALGKLGKDAIPVLEQVICEQNYPDKEHVEKILIELKDVS